MELGISFFLRTFSPKRCSGDVLRTRWMKAKLALSKGHTRDPAKQERAVRVRHARMTFTTQLRKTRLANAACLLSTRGQGSSSSSSACQRPPPSSQTPTPSSRLFKAWVKPAHASCGSGRRSLHWVRRKYPRSPCTLARAASLPSRTSCGGIFRAAQPRNRPAPFLKLGLLSAADAVGSKSASA